MKKRHMLVCLLMTVAGFSYADVITPSQARQIASDFLGEDIAPQNVRPMRGTPVAEEPLPLYIIERGEDRGWVIVSGNDALPSVLGYSDSGTFDPEDMSPAYRDMLDCYAAAAVSATEQGLPSRGTALTANAAYTSISPIIKSHWHQGEPYNNMCPMYTDENGDSHHCVVGCVATAAAQIIWHFRKDLPRQLQKSTPTYKGETADVTVSIPKGTLLEYDLMFESYNNVSSAEFRDKVALLCFAMGASANLDYGPSTGGWIDKANVSMGQYFGLQGTHVVRDNMSLDQWESVCYKSLEAAKPLLFCGWTTDWKSGHAIVLDGYNAKNGLWHFNFGWGGSGDGYYTLDPETGVNGFGTGQQVVSHITPLHPNIKGYMHDLPAFYAKGFNTVPVTITNNSTLPVSEFRLYLSTSEKVPSKTTTANDTKKDVVVPVGETVSFEMEVKPATSRNYYLYLTDANMNVLDHQPIVVEPSNAHLSFEGLSSSASDDVETVGDKTFQLLYNSAVTLTAKISNAPDATPAAQTVKFEVFEWDTETQTAGRTPKKTKSLSAVDFRAGETQHLSVDLTGLTEGNYYEGKVKFSTNGNDISIATTDTVVYFKVGAQNLQCTRVDDTTMRVEGGWNEAEFSSLATNDTIAVYDMTGVTGLNSQPKAANPNALFYTAKALSYTNCVFDNKCADLRLQEGYNFSPQAPLQATKASFDSNYTPGIWYTVVLPFDCTLPEGYAARRYTEFGSSTPKAAEQCTALQASVAYVICRDNRNSAPLSASDVEVAVKTDTTKMADFIGDFRYRAISELPAPEGTYALVLDTASASTTQYFSVMREDDLVTPFSPSLRLPTKKIKVTLNSTIDPAYRKLAQTIDEAEKLYSAYQPVIADSMNVRMANMLSEAHAFFALMDAEKTTPVNDFKKELEELMAIYPLCYKEVTHPIDYTAYIANPSFESGSKTGWKGDAYSTIKTNSSLATMAAGIDGSYFLYCNKSSASTDIYQTLTDLPVGWYRLTALVGADEGKYVRLFAGEKEEQIAASEFGKYYLTEGVVDSVYVDNGELTIGIHGSDTWYKADLFALQYLGSKDNTTHVDALEADEPVRREGIWDLQGRRISDASEMLPGVIYIVNGRKTVRLEK